MQAVVIKQSGGPEVLALEHVEEPNPGKGEVKIKVKATALNRADVLQRMGHYPSPPDVPPDIPGLEFAGTVEQLGQGVSGFAVGDKVFGLASGGTYAEYVVLPSACLCHMPRNLSFVEAAAIPEVFITAYDAMLTQCNLQPGETVLIHAVGSGVGLAAVQIGKFFGTNIIGTARSESKLLEAKKYGLENGLLVKDAKFASKVKEISGGAGANLILDLVGGKYISEDIIAAANKGRIIIVGLLAGLNSEIDCGQILRKRLILRGTTLRMRPLEEKIIAAKLLEQCLVPLFEKSILKPVIDKVLPLNEVQEAHAIMDKNENFGKIVLEVSK